MSAMKEAFLFGAKDRRQSVEMNFIILMKPNYVIKAKIPEHVKDETQEQLSSSTEEAES